MVATGTCTEKFTRVVSEEHSCDLLIDDEVIRATTETSARIKFT